MSETKPKQNEARPSAALEQQLRCSHVGGGHVPPTTNGIYPKNTNTSYTQKLPARETNAEQTRANTNQTSITPASSLERTHQPNNQTTPEIQSTIVYGSARVIPETPSTGHDDSVPPTAKTETTPYKPANCGIQSMPPFEILADVEAPVTNATSSLSSASSSSSSVTVRGAGLAHSNLNANTGAAKRAAVKKRSVKAQTRECQSKEVKKPGLCGTDRFGFEYDAGFDAGKLGNTSDTLKSETSSSTQTKKSTTTTSAPKTSTRTKRNSNCSSKRTAGAKTKNGHDLSVKKRPTSKSKAKGCDPQHTMWGNSG